MKQRRESIEVAEILSLVPQLEEKYSSLEVILLKREEKEKARGSVCLVLQLEKRTITDSP